MLPISHRREAHVMMNTALLKRQNVPHRLMTLLLLLALFQPALTSTPYSDVHISYSSKFVVIVH